MSGPGVMLRSRPARTKRATSWIPNTGLTVGDDVDEDAGRALALLASDVEVRDEAKRPRAEREEEHAAIARAGDHGIRVGGIVGQVEDEDVGLDRGQVELDPGGVGNALGDEAR